MKSINTRSCAFEMAKVVKRDLFRNRSFRPLNNSYSMVVSLASKFYQSLDSALSLSCYLLLVNNEIEQLVSKSCNPLDYNDLSQFADDHAAISFMRKYEGFPKDLKLNTYERCVADTVKSEKLCRHTNARFNTQVPSRDVLDVLINAKDLISVILGKFPLVDDLLEGSLPSFGPGVSSSCKGLDTSVYQKLQAPLDVTRGALPYAKALYKKHSFLAPIPDDSILDNAPYSLKFDVVPGNRFTTVPKNARTDRPICVEPHVNVVLQKYAGDLIRKRFSRFGITLDTQNLINQSMAKQGSIDGSIATVDLSSASDTISYEFVRNLLPESWFLFLDAVRSHNTCYENTWYRNDKFSSMGNGFTWELQSVLFYALAYCCTKHVCQSVKKVSIYGDDIIIPTEAYGLLEEVLDYCGFVINKTKSYDRSYFRESCGSDYWDGLNIRPYFLKEEVKYAHQIYSIANGIRHYAARRCNGLSCDIRFRDVWRWVVDRLRLSERSIGPLHVGDSVIWANESELDAFALPTTISGVHYCFSIALKAKNARRGHKELSGHTLTARSSEWVHGVLASPYQPPQSKIRQLSGELNINLTAIPLRCDSPNWT